MRRNKTFLKKTRKGKATADVSVPPTTCQLPWEGAGGSSSSSPRLKPHYIIPDTNVVLHQMDALEHLSFSNIIFLQTVLEETRHRNATAYKRARAIIDDPARHSVAFSNEHHRGAAVERLMGESPNDRNDRAIRVATRWFVEHVRDFASVTLLTNDSANRTLAQSQGLYAATLEEYVNAMVAPAHPALKDLLAFTEIDAGQDSKLDASSSSRRSRDLPYTPHWTEDKIKTGLASRSLFQGTFHVSRDSHLEGFVWLRGPGLPAGHERVLVSGAQRINRAVDGDMVAVRLLAQSEWQKSELSLSVPTEEEALTLADAEAHASSGNHADSKEAISSPSQPAGAAIARTKAPTAEVVGIVQRNWRTYCGCLEVSERKSGNILFVPASRRIPKIRIQTSQAQLLMDKRIMVQIDSWPESSKFPLGHYVRTVGVIGDRDTETKVILHEHDVTDEAWSNSVLQCLPGDDWKITPEEIAKRLDLRESHIIVSVDPPGCKDIDDALHCVPLPNGNYEVGVHIADVTHFIAPDTALDVEAAKRGTSVYLVDRRIDMIPTKLSTGLCSLFSKVDRLAFSVVWELTPNADIVRQSFHKTVINSKAALSYEQAQNRIDSGDVDPISVALRSLNALAKRLKAKRVAAGALELASLEVKFLLDYESQDKTPTDVAMYQLRETNQMVEEFMLLANISVAKHILNHFSTCAMLRRHPVPPKGSFDQLIKAAKLMGFDLKTNTSKELADSLNKARLDGYDNFNKMLRILATRCMSQAVYFSSGEVEPSEYRHYGLASDVYTHFTSPIRRYADIVVHRLLATSLGLAPLPPSLEDHARMSDTSQNINHRHRMAQLAGRSSVELFTLIYFKDRRVEESASVISVRKNGLRVIVPRFGIEAFIKMAADEEDEDHPSAARKFTFAFDDEMMSLTCIQRPEWKFSMFDRLKVRIYVTENKLRRRWLVTELIDYPELHADRSVSRDVAAGVELKHGVKRAADPNDSVFNEVDDDEDAETMSDEHKNTRPTKRALTAQ